MRTQPSAITLDIDRASLTCLGKALRGWEIADLNGQQASQVFRPKLVDLVVLGCRADVQETLDLCRFLVAVSAREGALPLVVLLATGQRHLIGDLLAAGARECLMLPVHPRQIRRLLARGQREHHAGTHTLNLHQPACDEPWRDVGGEG